MRDVIRADFDRIAALMPERDSVEGLERTAIDRVPPGCPSVLEVGCGAGAVARRLARKAQRVVGLDLSPKMIEVARRLSASDNLQLIEADFMDWPLPTGGFDAVVSIATLHHLPPEAGLARLASAVRPGGLLVVVDLFDASGVRALPYNVFSLAARWIARGRPGRPSPDLARAWREHERHDRFIRWSDVRATALRILGPSVRVRRPLGWRYWLEWRRAV